MGNKNKQVTLFLPAGLKAEVAAALKRCGINWQEWGRRLATATAAGDLDYLLDDECSGEAPDLDATPGETLEMLNGLLDRWGQKEGPIADAVRFGGEQRQQWLRALLAGRASLDPPPPPPPVARRFDDFED